MFGQKKKVKTLRGWNVSDKKVNKEIKKQGRRGFNLVGSSHDSSGLFGLGDTSRLTFEKKPRKPIRWKLF